MKTLTKTALLDFVREHAVVFDVESARNPFSSSIWISHFINEIGESDWNYFVEESRIGGESLMLLYSRGGSSAHRLALANYYTSLYSPVVTNSDDSQAATVDLITRATARGDSSCATITLAPMSQDLPEKALITEAFANNGWYVRQFECFGNWYLPCAGLTFEDYMNQRPSQLRNTWNRKRKRFDGGAAHIEIVTQPESLSAAMDAYERVMQKSWKNLEPYPAFVPGWAKLCADHGWLRLGIAWVGDTPIAVQFWFTMHGRASIFKLAYDEDFSQWSAGTVLTAHMIKYSIEQDCVTEIDYLTGDDNYKRSWMSERRQRVGLRACNLRSVGGMVAAAIEGAGSLRARWRQRIARRESIHPTGLESVVEGPGDRRGNTIG